MGNAGRGRIIRRTLFLLAGGMILCAGGVGCGKKAMPSPPQAAKLPVVTDLSYRLVNGGVLLTWTVPEKLRNGFFGEGEMILSRSRISISEAACSECPRLFQRVAIFDLPRSKARGKASYTEGLKHGFHYTYRVEFVMNSGNRSGPSNMVSFNY